MNVAIVGTGYVGLVTGACFSEMGINVYCVDVDEKKIESLKNGIIPIYEPNLESLVRNNYKSGRLHFTTDLPSVISKVEIIFSAVGTPPDEDGSADLRHVLKVARTIGENLGKYVLIVTKSTVPVGTAERVRQAVQQELDKRGATKVKFDVASNPEFLKEGSAIEDFMRPDRVILGVDSQRARELLDSLYKPMQLNNYRVIFMDITSAEMTKYAANSMLASRISLMNQFANLCEKVGANIDMVRSGLSTDSRIGSKFLYAGCGYGGSCFPKDVKALIKTAQKYGCDMSVLDAVERVNERQKHVLFEKFKNFNGGSVKGKRAAVWGLSFKPGTDDMREAPSLILIDELLNAGCEVSVYDPVAMEECKRRIGDKVKYAKNVYECSEGADVIFHVTEWKEFRMPDWHKIRKSMQESPLLIDGRNALSLADLKGITYMSIGKCV